jgi:hypothetical protein
VTYNVISVVPIVMIIFGIVGSLNYYYWYKANSILKKVGYSRSWWWGYDFIDLKLLRQYGQYLSSIQDKNSHIYLEHSKILKRFHLSRNAMLWLFFILFLSVTIFLSKE